MYKTFIDLLFGKKIFELNIEMFETPYRCEDYI